MKTALNSAGSSVFTLLLTAVVTLMVLVVSAQSTYADASSCTKRHTSSVSAQRAVVSSHGKSKSSYVIGKGSYYHKVATAFGAYTGIEGVVTLPAPQLDPQRVNKTGKPLDGFSIYMGGNADGQEVDAGFTWEKNPLKSASEPEMVWRPFARAKRWLDSDTDMTWSPGDTVRLAVVIVKDGVLRLSIDDVSGAHPRHYAREFEAWRFRRGAACQFKRVNAIDQCGREGKSTLATTSHVFTAVWASTSVLTGYGVKQVEHYLNEISHSVRDESAANIRVVSDVSQQKAGGESVDVCGDEHLLLDRRAPTSMSTPQTKLASDDATIRH